MKHNFIEAMNIPKEIIESIRTVELWMKRNNCHAIEGLSLRRFQEKENYTWEPKKGQHYLVQQAEGKFEEIEIINETNDYVKLDGAFKGWYEKKKLPFEILSQFQIEPEKSLKQKQFDVYRENISGPKFTEYPWYPNQIPVTNPMHTPWEVFSKGSACDQPNRATM